MTRFFVISCTWICNANAPALAVDVDGVLYDAIQTSRFPSAKCSRPVRRIGSRYVKPRPKVDAVEQDSPALKVAWDQWHHRVAELVYARYSTMADASFKDGKPLRARASYIVAKDGSIVEARITQSSPSARFNTIVLTSINSVSDTAILRFPADSHRNYVEKSAEFTMNAGWQGDFDPHPSELKNPPVVKQLAE